MSGHAPGRTYYSLPPYDPPLVFMGVDRADSHDFSAWTETWTDFIRPVRAGASRDPYREFGVHYQRMVEAENAVRQEHVMAATQDHVDALLDLARAGREGDFKELAAMVGVAPMDIDLLWVGTMKRVSPTHPRAESPDANSGGAPLPSSATTRVSTGANNVTRWHAQ